MATVEGLTAELESNRAHSTRQALEAEEALYELTNQLTDLQRRLDGEQAAKQAALEQSRAGQVKAQELHGELLKERESRTGDAALRDKLAQVQEQSEKEKRELLQVVERANTDKEALQGTSSYSAYCAVSR